jgi:phage shock protein PspC (stress-responsive transcriptional regulator)
MDRRLYRHRTNRIIAGVCGGVGEYLNIDPTFVRIFFVLLTLSNGIGVLVYFLLWIIIPPDDARNVSLGESARTGADEIAEHAHSLGEDLRQAVHNPTSQTWMYIGAGLIIIGFFALLNSLPWHWLHWLNWNFFWPVLLILGGIALVVRYFRKE